MKVSNEVLIKEAMQAQKKALKSAMIEHYVGGSVKLVSYDYERYGMKYFIAIDVKTSLTNGQKIARLRALPGVFQERVRDYKGVVIQFRFRDREIFEALADEITKEFLEEHGKATT